MYILQASCERVYELAHAQYIIVFLSLCMYIVQLYIGEGMIQEFSVQLKCFYICWDASVFTTQTQRKSKRNTGQVYFTVANLKQIPWNGAEMRWSKKGWNAVRGFFQMISNCFENAKFSINSKPNEKSCISLFSTPVGTE